jgi:ABC-type transport system involved in multi-copper enzyme maturation permease subunit
VTVHARGYRPYTGRLRAPPAAFAIAREAAGRIRKSVAFRRIGVLFLLWFAICAVMLYVSVGMGQNIFGRIARLATDSDQYSVLMLNWVLRMFYTGLSYLTALLAVFVGGGLIADDLSAGALPLYLARPLKAWDYVVGKALVLPLMLVGATLLPGLFLYLITGLWRPPGETWSFLGSHLDIPQRVLEYFLVTSALYTGLLLFLSSRSARRTAVAVVAAVLVFGGVLLQGIGIDERVRGPLGDALRLAGLPHDTTFPFIRATPAFGRRNMRELFPSPESVWILAGVLLALGLFFAWRRARSVEVTS